MTFITFIHIQLNFQRHSGEWWCIWLRHCITRWEVPGSISLKFSSDLIFVSIFSSPGVHSASNRNEYKGMSKQG
jgi:hypothetical protein